MGSLFSGGGLTNPNSALLDPTTGQALAMGKPQDVLAATGPMVGASAGTNPNNPLDMSPNIGPLPRIGQPSFGQAAQYGAMPGTINPLSPGLSKGGKLFSFLKLGLEGALAGRAAQENLIAESGGRRAGGIGTGFEAGYMLPFQRAQAAQQVALGQAALTPVETPYGTMPAEYATRTLLPAFIRGQAMQNVANTQAGAKTTSATIAAQGGIQKQNIATQGALAGKQLEAAIMAGKVSKFVADVDPQTGKPFYHVFNSFGKELSPVDDVNVIPQLMARTSSTVEYKQDADGNIIALPKTTVSGPSLPGRGAPQAGQNAPARTGGGPRIVAKGNVPNLMVGSMPDGTQIAGTFSDLQKAGASSISKLPANLAQQTVIARQLIAPSGLFALAEKDLSKFKPGELEALAPRWNEFLAGKVGAGDPRYVALRTHVNGLLSTALMQAHVGSRGGENMMEHFEDIANAGKMNQQTLRAALQAERDYVTEKAMFPPKAATQQQNGGRGAQQPNANVNKDGLQIIRPAGI